MWCLDNEPQRLATPFPLCPPPPFMPLQNSDSAGPASQGPTTPTSTSSGIAVRTASARERKLIWSRTLPSRYDCSNGRGYGLRGCWGFGKRDYYHTDYLLYCAHKTEIHCTVRKGNGYARHTLWCSWEGTIWRAWEDITVGQEGF